MRSTATGVGAAALAIALASTLVAGCAGGGPPSTEPGPAVTPTPSESTPAPSPAATAAIVAPTPPADAGPSGSPAASNAPSVAPATPTSPPPVADRVALSLVEVADGFASPLFVTGDGTGSGRLYVVEQGGRIRVVEQGGSVLPEPFLDVSDRVSAGGERGLLGLAFHPRYRANGLIYVDYTDRDGNTVVSEFRRAPGSAPRADASSERVVLRVDQPYSNHNGGMLAFGPDGYLYVGMGDGGSAGDPQDHAQDLGSLLGKILRIDVDHRDPGLAYAIPSDAPFAKRAGARPEIWASGLRNPWRFSFDAATGDLWIGDVGQGAWEEVDRLTAASGGGRGANLGWRLMEGRACFDPPTGCPTAGLTMPLAVYGHDVGCAITGGYVYGGASSPALDGVYLFSDSCTGRIWSLDSTGPDAQDPVLLLETGRPIVSFGQGDDRELYAVDIGGGVLRVVGTVR